jgi:hypothetical protein
MENLAFTRRHLLGAAAAGLGAQIFASPARASATPILVELFTSQGCSSCPPADILAGELMKKPGVSVVSFNVDYWDYLGWRDTLAKPEFTQRQMDYAHARGDNDVYTPQMVINGAVHAVGNNRKSVAAAIAAAQNKPNTVAIEIHATENEFIVTLPKGNAGSEATLWVMAVAPAVKVKIERGENAGLSNTYHNVVRNLVPAGMWDGTATTLKLPRKGIMMKDCKGCIAVLQKGKVGPLLGLAQWG